MFGTNSKIIGTIVRLMVNVTKMSSFILGVATLMIVDVVAGAAYFGIVWHSNVNVPFIGAPVTAGTLGLLISAATTAIQINFWSSVATGGKLSFRAMKNDPADMAGTLFFGAVMIVDFLVDLGGVTHLLYPNVSAWTITPPAEVLHQAGYLVVITLVMIMCVGNEPMLKMIMDRNEEKAPSYA